MEKAKPNAPINKFDEAFSQQITYDEKTKTYTSRCVVCGKTVSERKRWFRSHDGTLTKLRVYYNFCEGCGRWVCEDCYLVYDKDGNSVISCADCAKKRGVTGLTNKQFNEIWPEIERRRREKREAAKKEQAQKNREQP